MPGRIFFRDECASVTSGEVAIGKAVYPMEKIHSARALRRRSVLNLVGLHQYVLLITTASGEREVLRHRNGYLIFQLAKAIEAALREAGRGATVSRATAAAIPPPNDLTGSLAT
jgi:hypothetical protein